MSEIQYKCHNACVGKNVQPVTSTLSTRNASFIFARKIPDLSITFDFSSLYCSVRLYSGNQWTRMRSQVTQASWKNKSLINPSNADDATFVQEGKAQEGKNLWKPSKPCHVGTHWIALTDYSQMNTHTPGVQRFPRIFALFCIGQFSHHQHKGWLFHAYILKYLAVMRHSFAKYLEHSCCMHSLTSFPKYVLPEK